MADTGLSTSPEKLATGPRHGPGKGIPGAATKRGRMRWITGRGLTIIWLVFAWMSWPVAIGGVSRAQADCNPGDGQTGVHTWSYLMGGPQISCKRVFRFDWWTVCYDLAVLVMVTICLSKKMKYLATARCMLVGYLAVATVLSIISADRFNNLRNVTAHRGNIHIAARVGFAGNLMMAFCWYTLMYMIGVDFEGFNVEEMAAAAALGRAV